MPAFRIRRVWPTALILAAVLGLSSGRPASAQFGFGYGDPFMMFAPALVPSPTGFLNDLSLQRASAAANSSAQRADQTLRASPNAYWNRVRENTGEASFDLSTRRSLAQRAGSTARPRPPAPAPAPPTTPPRPEPRALDAFFLASGEIDWPRDAIDEGPLRSDRAEADAAVKHVRDEIRDLGSPTAQTLATARYKLITYGQKALLEVRAARSSVVADVFHYYLLFFNDALGKLAGDAAK